MYLKVSNREFDTILAALRLWQRTGNMACPEWSIAVEHGPPMEFKALDRLCERLNADDPLPGQLLAALERAVGDCESRNDGGEADYGWVNEAETAIAAAKAAGIEGQP